EGPSLSAVEKRDLVQLACKLAPDLAIVLGIATPSLDEALWLSKQAAKSGAASVLVMAPYYFKEASPEGMKEWFVRILEGSPLPVLLYNFPQRSGFTFDSEFLSAVADHDNLLGVKDSSGDEGNLTLFRQLLPDKLLFVGNELLLIKALHAGWNGTISGVANVIPNWLFEIVEASDEAKFELIRPTIGLLRSSPQPATNKALLQERSVIEHNLVRLPLLPAKSISLPIS
ncbi:MAG: dihydrodipicolinate synthase family protein, partial [Fimbriimonadaceae bacterium]